MADFSKQWCKINDPEMPWDFDIEEEATTIPKEHWKLMICEGFGFTVIAKDKKDNILLGFLNLEFPDYAINGVVKWKTYEEVINLKIG
jgi:hypothetical protein